MPFSNLIRLGGLAAVLAGALLALAELLYLVIGLSPPSGPEYFTSVSYAFQAGVLPARRVAALGGTGRALRPPVGGRGRPRARRLRCGPPRHGAGPGPLLG